MANQTGEVIKINAQSSKVIKIADLVASARVGHVPSSLLTISGRRTEEGVPTINQRGCGSWPSLLW